MFPCLLATFPRFSLSLSYILHAHSFFERPLGVVAARYAELDDDVKVGAPLIDIDDAATAVAGGGGGEAAAAPEETPAAADASGGKTDSLRDEEIFKE